MDQEPKPVGRPSSYRPEFNDTVIELGKDGKSLAQMCARFDIGRTTIDRWAEDHPKFREALNRAKIHAQDWWETKAQENLGNKEFQTPLWKKSMEARFREDYTERREDTNTIKADDSVAGLMAAIATRGRDSSHG